MLYIYDYLLDAIKNHLEHNRIKAKVDYYIGRAWHCYRYIQVIPSGWENSIHYEYREGHWELHFEDGKESATADSLRRALIDKLADDGRFTWHRWSGRQRGLLRHITEIEDQESFREIFTELYDATFSLLKQGNTSHANSLFETLTVSPKVKWETSYTEYIEPNPPLIESISQLRFDHFKIPHYQRPYKWTVRNVNQLIDDILRFRKSGEYRLGTLVLYAPTALKDNTTLEVVDGQQRVITLALLLALLMREDKYGTLFGEELRKSLSVFLREKHFHESITRANIAANLQAIRLRLPEFDEEIVKFLLDKCKFVVFVLHDISEAFQFFDSQNARGMELLPHDLLKAFHLRAIANRSKEDRENISAWQNFDAERLAFLFLLLFRIKSWIKAKEGRFFTSKDIGEFKGLDESFSGLPFQKIYTIAQCYTEGYNRDSARRLDGQKLDFPHQIDQVVINGSLFFDMIRFYHNRLTKLENIQMKANPTVMEAVASFGDGAGNKYTKFLFDSACMFYYDKFGENNFATVMERIFAWTYGRRLKSYAIRLATIDKLGRGAEGEGFFSMLHNAVRPNDVLNWSVPVISKNEIAKNQSANSIAMALLEKLHYVE